MFLTMDECHWCKNSEERLWRDSWTGMELCNECIHQVAYHTTNSPGSEGDNLLDELKSRAWRRENN